MNEWMEEKGLGKMAKRRIIKSYKSDRTLWRAMIVKGHDAYNKWTNLLFSKREKKKQGINYFLVLFPLNRKYSRKNKSDTQRERMFLLDFQPY